MFKSTRKNNPYNHPSRESQYKQIKPTIKVGYVTRKSVQQKTQRIRKKVQKPCATSETIRGLKKVENYNSQNASGEFIESAYLRSKLSAQCLNIYGRKGVQKAHEKYQSGRQVQQGLKQNKYSKMTNRSASMSSSVATEKTKQLPSYQKQGIKDILQYHYAGQYRQNNIKPKCTQQSYENQVYKFNNLHQFDFRKKNRML